MAELDELGVRAVRAAVSVAESLGLACDETEVLGNSANTLILLQPVSTVARVATTTGQVWDHVRDRLHREVALATYLQKEGLPVVSPVDTIDPGPHEFDGLQMTFWPFVDADSSERPSPEQLAPHLADLHLALQSYSEPLPFMSPALEETRSALDYLGRKGSLSSEDLDLLNRVWAESERSLASLSRLSQPLHGDAHAGNVICRDGQFLWTDFEDCCSGPVAWDLACLTQSTADRIESVVAAYGTPVDIREVNTCVRARRLQGIMWLSCLSCRFPERQAETSEYLERWRDSISWHSDSQTDSCSTTCASRVARPNIAWAAGPGPR